MTDRGNHIALRARRTGWPHTRLHYLRGLIFGNVRHCELCNWDHHSWECGLIDHTRYVGIFDGLLHADLEVLAYYKEHNTLHATDEEREHWAPLLRRASSLVGWRNGYKGSKCDEGGRLLA